MKLPRTARRGIQAGVALTIVTSLAACAGSADPEQSGQGARAGRR